MRSRPAPLLALAQLALGYALLAPACARQDMMRLHASAALLLGLALAMRTLAWRAWRERGRPALTGTLSVLVILAMWFPQWAALLFCGTVLGPATRDGQGAALLSLFTTMLHGGTLGALLTLSLAVWYARYRAGAAALGVNALEEQQLGGLLMWGPAGLACLLAGVWLAARWLDGAGRRMA